ncbi:MAG: CPBP family intramembrane metalloprotease [Proteobacteria bacterium]|nr:CPBP family intramembrane metalloprotease [Pseudomonadota bacterium]
MLRNIGVSFLKILAFLIIWACLTGVAVWATVSWGGENFYLKLSFRVGLEIALTVATLIPLGLLAHFVDHRRRASLGFSARFHDLLSGAIVGACIFCLSLVALVATGAAHIEPHLASFSARALAIGLIVCFFNVVTQEALVRSYMFQELWAKYGAWVATIVTTIVFVALHANPISHGTQGLIAGANILLASSMLSLAYVRTGQLWLPIGIHLGWNGLQGPVLGINVTGNDLAFGHWSVFAFPGDALWTGGAMGVEGGLAGLIGPAIGIAIVAFAFKQQPQPDFSRVESATK